MIDLFAVTFVDGEPHAPCTSLASDPSIASGTSIADDCSPSNTDSDADMVAFAYAPPARRAAQAATSKIAASAASVKRKAPGMTPPRKTPDSGTKQQKFSSKTVASTGSMAPVTGAAVADTLDLRGPSSAAALPTATATAPMLQSKKARSEPAAVSVSVSVSVSGSNPVRLTAGAPSAQAQQQPKGSRNGLYVCPFEVCGKVHKKSSHLKVRRGNRYRHTKRKESTFLY